MKGPVTQILGVLDSGKDWQILQIPALVSRVCIHYFSKVCFEYSFMICGLINVAFNTNLKPRDKVFVEN